MDNLFTINIVVTKNTEAVVVIIATDRIVEILKYKNNNVNFIILTNE